jgi:hypothetical protein
MYQKPSLLAIYLIVEVRRKSPRINLSDNQKQGITLAEGDGETISFEQEVAARHHT